MRVALHAWWRNKCSVAVAALAAIAALTALVHSAGGDVVLASTWSIANMLASQQPSQAGKKGPEIPDPHPDPE